MKDLFNEELRDGESLLWCGKPEAFEIMDRTYKQHLIRRAIVIIGVVTAICVIYLLYASSKGITIKPVLVALAMAGAIMGAANGFLEGKKLRRMCYAITDQRIISVLELPKSLEFNRVKEVAFKTDKDGHTSILFGTKTIKSKAHSWRNLALADPYIDEGTGFCTRFVMYAVPEAEKIKEILGQYISI